ncbi:hypothetical protein ACTXT7_004251 [Hymenolepis weldensis]
MAAWSNHMLSSHLDKKLNVENSVTESLRLAPFHDKHEDDTNLNDFVITKLNRSHPNGMLIK